MRIIYKAKFALDDLWYRKRLCQDGRHHQYRGSGLGLGGRTGYKWEEVKHDEYILQKIGETEFESQPDLVGAPGVEIFRFKAVNTGQGALKLVYHRFWEKDVQPQRTFSLKVLVR